MPDESIRPPAASNNIIAAGLSKANTKLKGEFKGSCLKQKKVAHTHKIVINVYIVY